jgi:hypothetical protein
MTTETTLSKTTAELIDDPQFVAAACMLRQSKALDVLDVEIATADHPGFILRVTEKMAQYRAPWDTPYLDFYAGKVSFARLGDNIIGP